MISWDTHCPFSKKKHGVQSKRFCKLVHEIAAFLNGRKTAHPKVFDLYRKNSSRNMIKQTGPQEPEHVLLSLILIDQRNADCAVLFAAPRLGCVALYHHGCRGAGTPPCMNMLRCPVFRAKTVQPSWSLRSFSHESHVSGSFYRLFLLRDQRHCLQVL